MSDDFDDMDNPLFAANPANSTVKNNIIVNRKKSIGSLSDSAEKYSTIENNSLFTLKDNPFTGDKGYGSAINSNGEFKALPVKKMGRTYTIK